ncbi:MAG: Gfo/Idh/MocA family oxidoreductase [Pirellulaceae bacterium]|nr:Gfo/Idh/MocA family oxidoreductase [Pirellulaceae bacterium]
MTNQNENGRTDPTKSHKAPGSGVSRRQFHKAAGTAIGAAAGFHFFPALADKKLEKPTLAGIGIGGKGSADITGASKAGFEVVALCDIVDFPKLGKIDGSDKKFQGRIKNMGKIRREFPEAKFFSDYRQMIADLGDKVDAVTVSTPDHHHFHASAQAMLAGKHVYCQKPLTHGIWEARTLTELAKRTGVKTQMGNQAHANDHMRRCVELIRAGVVGKVTDIHAWTNRPIWPQGFRSPPAKQAVPAGIDWDQWVGPAPWVDYSPRIAPFAWRGWWNYGTGALGDMACHIMDLGYWAMDTPTPQSVKAKQQGATDLSPPINSVLTWNFGPGPFSGKAGFKFHWYDGYVDAKFDRDNWQLVKNGDEYNHPSEDILEGMDFAKFGSVIIGTDGKLFFNRSRNTWVLKTNSHIDGFTWPEKSIPRATNQNNYQEWYDAIDGTVDQGQSNFALAGPMTETILLGVMAQRNPDTELQWDRETMTVKDRPDLQKYIQREYRSGWTTPV